MRSKRAFTLVEIIAVSVIMVIVLMAVLSTYVLLSRYVRDTAVQARLQSRTRIAVDRMARDMRLASSVSSCPASGTSIVLRFIPGKLGLVGEPWESRYRLAEDKILYAPNTASPTETIILDNVNLDVGDKLFEYNGGQKEVTVNTKVKNVTISNVQNAWLTTIIKLRNAD